MSNSISAQALHILFIDNSLVLNTCTYFTCYNIKVNNDTVRDP